MPSPLMLEMLGKHIIPLIIDSVDDACIAYDATKKANGDNYSDSYTFGSSCYAILKNRLRALLPPDSGFKLEISNNIVRVAWEGDGDAFRFHVYKVEPATRLFSGADRVKTELRGNMRQCWLFPEAEAFALAPDGYVNNLGYDASTENGLGSVTLDRVRHVSGNEYEVKTLHRFEMDHNGPGGGRKKDAMHPAPETIQKASVAYNPSFDADKVSSE